MEKFSLPSRLVGLEKNVWVEIAKLHRDVKPLNLGLGFPEDLVPTYVLELLSEVAKESALINQYTRGFGHPRLLTVLGKLYSRWLQRKVPLDVNNEVIVTVGAYGALFTAITGLVCPGDEVIIIEPFFDCYEPMVTMAGGIPKFIALKPVKSEDETHSSDWKLNPEELESLFTEKTKALIFNNPNNPLGKVFTRIEMEMVAKLCQKYNVVCISDEVYEHIVFDGSQMIRMATLPDMWERTITIGSAGKSFSVTGWKLGWAIGPNHLLRNCRVVHQNSIYICPTPTQEALARALEVELGRLDSPDCYFNSISVDLKRKRDFVVEMLREVGFNPVVPEGGYFILADWSKLAPEIDLSSNDGDTYADYRFVKWLCQRHKLLGIPSSAFFSETNKSIGEDYIRLCFIKQDDTLNKAKEILRVWRNEMNSE